MITATDIFQSIECYAKAYEKIQSIQEQSPLIPKGDQKTGCIGECYGYLYLRGNNPKANLKYGSHSEKGWDIEYKANSVTK